MATAPAVQNINDLIAQYTAAFRPQADQIDQEVGANESSGAAQVAGLDQAKTNAFNDISQRANNNGMFFSGQGIENQGRYTGATYLPALAKVQGAIAGVRNTLFGKKADLYTSANTNAINTHQQQQSAYDSWVQEQEKMAADAAENEKQRAFQASQAAMDRSVTRGSSGYRGSGSSSSSSNVNPAQDFLNYIGAQFKASGKNPSRQTQDAWANAWFNNNKVSKANRQGYWDLYNTTYKRTADPTKDHLYKK